jgi:sugar/nucleoside kinase (ribokinase family)
VYRPLGGSYHGGMGTAVPIVVAPRRLSFDVICAGEPLWKAARDRGGVAASAVSAGLLNVARMLARTQVRVGMATVLEDDRFGRASLGEIAALGINIGGVKLGSPVTELVVVDAAGGQSRVVSDPGTAPELEIPRSWSSPVLLLSGLSSVTSRLAAFCKAARGARREGTLVVLDAVGSLRHWAGRDPRVISMVLREADVVRCSYLDLAVIGTDPASVRRTLRPNATLVVNDAAGATATGAFGEVRVKAPPESMAAAVFSEAYTAAICAEFARPERLEETPSGRWHRILANGAPRMARSWEVMA